MKKLLHWLFKRSRIDIRIGGTNDVGRTIYVDPEYLKDKNGHIREYDGSFKTFGIIVKNIFKNLPRVSKDNVKEAISNSFETLCIIVVLVIIFIILL